jgi:hypothetical protein
VRSVIPYDWSERKFWSIYYINIGKNNYRNTKELVKYISTLYIKNNEALKATLILNPESVSLRACIRVLFKNYVHFQRLMKNEYQKIPFLPFFLVVLFLFVF